MSLRRLGLRTDGPVAADSHNSEDHRREPNADDQDITGGRQGAGHANGFEERLHVDYEDDAGDRRPEDARREQPDDKGRQWRREESTDEQRADHGPGDLGEAEADEEAQARAQRHNELAGVAGADDLSRPSPPGTEPTRRGGWAP